MTTISLDDRALFGLACDFAGRIHGEIINRRLSRVGAVRCDIHDLPSIRKSVASLSDKYERGCFVSNIRNLLRLYRNDSGTPATWQEWEAKVAAARL